LNTPIKILDEEGDIKKIILEKTINFNVAADAFINLSLKFPRIAPVLPSTDANITIDVSVRRGDVDANFGISNFKIIIHSSGPSDEEGVMTGELDASLNHGKLVNNERRVCTYNDDDYPGYYFRLGFNGSPTEEEYVEATYHSVSTNVIIPDDFDCSNMIEHDLGNPQYKWCETYIRTIPTPPPRTIAPLDVTLNSTDKNAGTSDQYARGDHVHYLNLSFPIKFFDSGHFTSKFIINYTFNLDGPSNGAIYLKFPYGIVGLCEINSSVFYFNESTIPAKFDSSQILIKIRTAGYTLVTIETALSHAVLGFSTANVIYTTINEEACYYIKIPYNLSTYSDNIYVTYQDFSFYSRLPDEFTTNNMLIYNTTSETVSSNIIKVYTLPTPEAD
jgi:hypothetical protein